MRACKIVISDKILRFINTSSSSSSSSSSSLRFSENTISRRRNTLNTLRPRKPYGLSGTGH